MGSWTFEPRLRVVLNPSPISKPLNAWIPMTAAAILESSLSYQFMQEPIPMGRLKICVSTIPPTVSFSTLAFRMASIIFCDASGSGQ